GPERISIIPPWPREDVVHYSAERRERFRAAHGLAGKFVVMYSGNHSPCHPLTTLLEAAARLKERADIAFLFVGGGRQPAGARRCRDRPAVAPIVPLRSQPLDSWSAPLSAADLHVVVMGDPFVGIIRPCKVYNIRALGIPSLYMGPAASHVAELDPAFEA